jgi:L-amino acid N-acyltransferase YncA
MSMHIRLAEERDAEPVAAIYRPEVLETPITFEIEPPTVEEFRRRIRETLATHPWLVCERDGEVLAYAYASVHRARAAYRWGVDVTVYNHRQARGIGIGRALYTGLLGILPLQGFCTAYAGITLPNAGSVGLHQSMGFQPVGVYRRVGYKLGAWRDVGWWDLTLQPHPAEPAEPRPLPELLGTAEVAAVLARADAALRRS